MQENQAIKTLVILWISSINSIWRLNRDSSDIRLSIRYKDFALIYLSKYIRDLKIPKPQLQLIKLETHQSCFKKLSYKLKPFSCKIFIQMMHFNAVTILQTLLLIALQSLDFKGLMNVSKMLKTYLLSVGQGQRISNLCKIVTAITTFYPQETTTFRQWFVGVDQKQQLVGVQMQ